MDCVLLYFIDHIVVLQCYFSFKMHNHPDAKKRHRAHNRSITYIMCERAVSTTRELHSSRRQALVRLPTRRHDLVHTKRLACWILAPSSWLRAPGSDRRLVQNAATLKCQILCHVRVAEGVDRLVLLIYAVQAYSDRGHNRRGDCDDQRVAIPIVLGVAQRRMHSTQ